MKKLWASVFWMTALVLCLTGGARAAEARCLDFDGECLHYELYTGSGWQTDGACIAASYDETDMLQEVRIDRPDLVPQARADRRVRFDAPAARVRLFALDSLSKLAPGIGDAIAAGETRLERCSFAGSAFQALGELSETVTVDGVRFNYQSKEITLQNGYAYLYGGGNLQSCSITVTAKGPCRVKVTVESVDRVSERTVRVVDAQNAVVGDRNVTARDTLVYDYAGPGGELTVFSRSSGVNVYAVELVYGKEPATPYTHLYADSWEALHAAVTDAPAGAVVHLRGGVIPCEGTLSLSGDRGVTIRGSEETTTILDFTAWSDQRLNTPDEVTEKGIYVRGSGVSLENFIIQGVPGSGIAFYGATCHDNRAENVVSRYNHNAGFTVTGGAANTTLVNCVAYRNCDIYKKGQDADGFAISVDCGAGTVLRGCHAFENGDDGYDNFNNHNAVTYLDCTCWNNGNIDVYTGKWDVDHGRPVDENLGFVRLLRRESPAFAAALDAGRWELPLDATVLVRSRADTNESVAVTMAQYLVPFDAGRYRTEGRSDEALDLGVWEGNGNGFKLGSAESKHGPQVGPDTTRRLENCVAFDHPAKGFDRNGGVPTVTVKNILCFDNYKNYWSDGLTLAGFENVLGYRGTIRDTTDADFAVRALDRTEGEVKAAAVRTRAAALEARLRQDILPGEFRIDPGW